MGGMLGCEGDVARVGKVILRRAAHEIMAFEMGKGEMMMRK
jgi:hypothetical protein